MSDPTTIANEPLDYSFLLVTHMVCADQQIHNKELKYLHRLEQHTGVGQRTKQEKEKILAQDEHLIPVDVLAQGVPQKQRNQAMVQTLVMAYIDGFYSPLEHQMVEQVGRIWNWSVEEIQRLVEYEEVRTTVQPIQDESSSRDSLWDDPDYETAIFRCAEIAFEDYTFAEAALQAAGATLDNLRQGIQQSIEAIRNKTSGNTRAETAKEVAQQLETTKQSLEVEIVKKIKSVRESLDAKQRALNYFTIAFMGKTKAGKSTLHAVMTDQGWDAIGVGRQRTTRLNRVYEWKKIRIIDTPGIGAPGGKTDEEIARSVINESDVICYVVTNDSIQETEFGFLRLLKESAKPLIILLNIKNNLRDPRRLEHFLKNPDKLFAMDGQSGLGGHIERIRRYAKDHYANGYFEIVPVMLLAAQLSGEPEHQPHKAQLLKASRMQNFKDEIWLSLVEQGAIRRSQTLLGCTVGNINDPYNWVKQQTEVYQKLTDTIKKKRDTVRKPIKTAEKDALESLQHQIEAIFQDALKAIPSFAEDYWNSSESGLKGGWEQKLKDIGFESRLETVYQEAGQTFNKKVQEAIEEVGKELQLIAKLSGGKFSFTEQDSGNERDFFRIGGGILGVAGALLIFVAPPIGLVISIIGGALNFLGGFLKSKDQKRREAVQNISSSLRDQLNNYKETTLENAKEQFGKHCEYVTQKVDAYFEDLMAGLGAIAKQLEDAQSKLDSKANNLNHAYAKRIIDWCVKRYEPLTREGIDGAIAEVSRDFGRSMTIKTKSFLQLQRPQNEINSVLQEDISIQIPTSPTPADAKNSNVQIPTSPTPEAAINPKRKFLGVVGIDLGTTNSAVAVMKNGQPVAIANKEGFTSTPSVVAYTQGGACLVGQTAKRQAITNPENTFDSVMRFIGCKYDEVTKEAKQVSYRVLRNIEGNVKIDCPVLGQQFTPEEILAQVLRKLADDASQHLDAQVTQVAIAVPAYFNKIQRHAVMAAGRIAGLEVLRIISHPTAAALAYGLNKDRESDEAILVFDLGGGHFSVSILVVGAGVFEVLATSGDTQLGGNDFDQKIVDWLAQEFKQLEGIDLLQNNQALPRLTEAAEQAKIELSSATQTEIDLPWITSTASGPKHLKMTLTRSKFEQLCADLIDRCRSIVDNALRDAKLDKSDIDEVILVGGSTRIPAVQEFVRRLFGKEPKQGFNSDESVAKGAAVQAGILTGEVTGILALDVTPLTLGVETLGGVMTRIIPRNTTIPTKKSEVISTTVDGQTYVEIDVLQGEREMASDNKSLGILRLDGIPPAPRGVPQIEVTFYIDANGILNVTAKDKGTGKEQSMTITGASTLSQEEVERTSGGHKGMLANNFPVAPVAPVVDVINSISRLVNPFS